MGSAQAYRASRRGTSASTLAIRASGIRCTFIGLPLVVVLGLSIASCSNKAASDGCPGDFGCDCVESDECNAGLFCSDGGHCIAQGGTSNEGSSASDTAANVGGPPEIVSLEGSMSALSSRIAVVSITAQVVDPDGLDDLVGGLARDAADDALIGPFVQLSGGTFELGLAWVQLDAAGKTNDSDPLRIHVAFTDASGNEDEDELDLLVCSTAHDACDGTCVTLDTKENCGVCGGTCSGAANVFCVDGACCVPDPYSYYPSCMPPQGASQEDLPLARDMPPGPHAPYHSGDGAPRAAASPIRWNL